MIWRRVFLSLISAVVLMGLFKTHVAAIPIPAVSLDVPPEVKLGETFTFTVTFSNTHPSDAGYGPLIDIILPFNGADGAAGTATPDGVDFIRAEYLGQPVQAEVRQFPVIPPETTGCVNHPYLQTTTLRPVEVCGTSGDKLITLELPFGSIVSGQPAVEVEITAIMSSLADVGVPLEIQARGAFRFGANPVDDPCCDLPQITAFNTAPVIPVLLSIAKENDAPEGEVATGPNHRYTWTVNVDIADGQTITDLDVTDYLPNNVVVDVNSLQTTPAGGVIIQSPTGGGPANPPDNLLIIKFPLVTGGPGENDITISFEFYAPYLDANGNPVINPQSGAQVTAQNNISAAGDWGPNDPRDGAAVDNANVNGLCPTVCPGGNAPILMALAGQKTGFTVPNGEPIKAGTLLEYTFGFQISDFFAINDLVVADTLSSGLEFDGGFAPQLSLTGGSITNFTAVAQADGTTLLTFDLSAELGGVVRGGCVPADGTGGAAPDCSTNNGPTLGIITYRATVRDNFLAPFPDPSVDHGDLLANEATIAGDIVDVGDAATELGTQATDDTEELFSVVRGTPVKSIYAYNGIPCGACTNLRLAAGDTLTYRIRQEMPSSDFESFQLEDYLPLPVFRAAELTTFSTALDDSVPPAGTAKLIVPGDTLHTLTNSFPVLSTDSVSNLVVFDFGSFDTPTNQQSFIDLLFTVTMQTTPIADGLFVTNLSRAREGSTNGAAAVNDAITQVQITGPLLRLSKGVVSKSGPEGDFIPANVGPVAFAAPGAANPFEGVINSNGLAGAPINSNLSGIQPGDVVKFAVVIENLGSSRNGAFDIRLSDILPEGFSIPDVAGLNLQVQLGSGQAVNWVGLGSGTPTDFFAEGIELVDPNLDTGVCGPYNGVDGTNIIVITYDLVLREWTDEILKNTVTVSNYGSAEGGEDYTGSQDLTESADIIRQGTGDSSTGDGSTGTTGGGSTLTLSKVVDRPFALAGDLVTWTIAAMNTGNLPVPNVMIEDRVPDGVNVESVSASQGQVLVHGQSYQVTVDTLAPGETITLTVRTRIKADVDAPFIITNNARAFAGGLQINAADSSVTSAGTMPATGETPSIGMGVILLAALLSGGVLVWVGIYGWRKKNRQTFLAAIVDAGD